MTVGSQCFCDCCRPTFIYCFLIIIVGQLSIIVFRWPLSTNFCRLLFDIWWQLLANFLWLFFMVIACQLFLVTVVSLFSLTIFIDRCRSTFVDRFFVTINCRQSFSISVIDWLLTIAVANPWLLFYSDCPKAPLTTILDDCYRTPIMISMNKFSYYYLKLRM